MYGRFIKFSEAEHNLQKIIKLEYSGKVDDYPAQITYLNRASRVFRPAQRYHLKQGLNQEILTMMSLVSEVEEDKEFIKLI